MRLIISTRILVPLNLFEVLPHLAGLPARIARHIDNPIPIVILRQTRHARIMHRAPAQNSSTGVLNTQQLGALGRVQPDVKGPIPGVPGGMLELEVARRVIRVFHPEIPARGLVVGGLVEVLDVRVRRVVPLIRPGFDEQGRVASAGKLGGKGTAAGTGAYDDVIVGVGRVRLGGYCQSRGEEDREEEELHHGRRG